ncbi:MAG: hypothetical protein ACLPHI_18575 [Terriglobales bacterium]|jgi:hypothetical protein
MALALAAMLGTASVQAQEATSPRERSVEGMVGRGLDEVARLTPDEQQSSATGATTDEKSPVPDAPTPATKTAGVNNASDDYGKQPKRILWIIPNYRAVSANTHLPPLSFKSKFWLATQDTFDYSDFILVGGLAGISMANKSEPSFHQGAAGYGRYYWHIFADGGIENYMTEAIVPAATREDPRYYTMGTGGFFKRTGYAVSRLFITRTDGGRRTINLSELVGAGAAAGIGNAYYPAQSNPFVKTYQRWGTEVGLDGVFNVLKEFWPDVNQAVFHGKY